MLISTNAKELFLSGYSAGDEAFEDSVVLLIRQLVDSTNLFSNLIQKYGLPLWEVGKSFVQKSGKVLVVPMKVENRNSLSSFIVFTETNSVVGFRVYEKGIFYPNIKYLDEMFMHYESSLFSDYSFVDKKTVSQGESSEKNYVAVTTCWNVYYSLDHGETWIYSYTSCTTFYEWMYSPIPGINGYVEIGSGGGGGTTLTGPNFNFLSSEIIKAIENIKAVLISNNCINKQLFDQKWNSSITIQINSSANDYSTYNSSTNVVEFKSSNNINEQSLLHEFFHAYQELIKGDRYTPTQTGEFETWLYVDLYYRRKGIIPPMNWSNNLTTGLQIEYYKWLDSIIINGITTGSNGNSSMCTYWFNLFMLAKPGYSNYAVGSSTFPSSINSLINNCKNSGQVE